MAAKSSLKVISTLNGLTAQNPRTVTVGVGAETTETQSGSRGINCALSAGGLSSADTTAATCAVAVTGDATVYYKSLDNAGNWSAVESTNISQYMPDSYYNVSEAASYTAANGKLATRTYQANGAAPTQLTYSYNNSSHPFGVSAVSDGRSFDYDDNGNVISYSYGGVAYAFSYDADNRLAKISGGSGAAQVDNRYVYGSDGNRTISKENGTTGKIVVDVFDGVFEATLENSSCDATTGQPTPTLSPSISGDNTFTSAKVAPGQPCVTWKVYYGGVERTQASTGADVIQTILTDNLGSTRAVVTNSAAPVKAVRYSVWGEVRDTTALPTDLGYTGQERVSNLQIMYYNARWYDVTLGRFLQPDSMIPDVNNPLDFDRYAYSRNNPINYNDPSGHIPAPVVPGPNFPDIKIPGWFEPIAHVGCFLFSCEVKDHKIHFKSDEMAVLDLANPVGLAYKPVEKLGKAVGKSVGEKLLKEISEKVGLETAEKASKLVDGMKLPSNDALDAAIEFLGKGYKEVEPGRFVSEDGFRQVRMKTGDILGTHPGANGPHLNFEIFAPSPKDPSKMIPMTNYHIYLELE